MCGERMTVETPTQGVKVLWAKKFFKEEKTAAEIKKGLEELDCNPTDQSLYMALSRAKFLRRTGPKGKYRYKHRYASKDILLNDEVLPENLIQSMGDDFKTEVADLKLNYGRSGTCTAFLLRKILEKIIFLSFAKNALSDQLKDGNGGFVGLKTMLNLATTNKVRGKPFLMPKTAKAIVGIKFLGDTSAHNPITNVDMKTITPQMPFIVTAYEELSKKL